MSECRTTLFVPEGVALPDMVSVFAGWVVAPAQEQKLTHSEHPNLKCFG